MQVQFDVPEDVARRFATDPGGVTRAAVEALAAEAVRSGKLTVHQARQLLGVRSRYEMDGFLKAHGVYFPITIEDVITDSRIASDHAKSPLSSRTRHHLTT